ncbi:MAG TPA: diaminobutyrate acetyltransferase [Nocardioidaceae bacterium]|nr:diaminobutyrate acetyltransferase [Nocardioidaceae bacterium]
MSSDRSTTPTRLDADVEFRRPTLEDGQALWRLARDSQVLDLNSSYTYLLWCRDFAATSIIAIVDGRPGGFITGYIRPDQPDTLLVWQVAVDAAHRGRRLARRMLDELVDRPRGFNIARMETTITPDNEASVALFSSFAAGRGAQMEREPIFTAELFPDGHQTEMLFRIGPLN